jgi:hypothetical protein
MQKKQLTNKLRVYREARRMKQVELAARAAYSRNCETKVLKGKME